VHTKQGEKMMMERRNSLPRLGLNAELKGVQAPDADNNFGGIKKWVVLTRQAFR
jgi:hypothetical protein